MPIFGGQTGKAEEALKTRKSRVDQAVDDQSSDSKPEVKPVADTTRKDEKPVPRPAMSKKWYE